MPAKRDRRCLHGVGGIFIPHILPIGNFILDLFFTSWYCSFTTNGEGEPGAATARRKLEPDGGSPNKYEHGKPQAHGSGKARDGRK